MNAYDFDDTIYAGDSSLHFFVFFLRKDPSLIKYLPKVISILNDYHKEKYLYIFHCEYQHFLNYVQYILFH